MRSTRQVLASTAMVVAIIAGSASTGSAVTAAATAARPSHTKLVQIVHDSEYGLKSRYYNHWYGSYPNIIIWKTDGCSIPTAIANRIPDSVERKLEGWFHNPCVIHDFGYRNYGAHAGGLALNSTSARRASIDSHFKDNMAAACDNFGFFERIACYGAREIFYGAVRVGGGASFY